MSTLIFDALFTETNFSKLPHKITEFLPTLSKKPSSLFVLVYIVRHTLGWQKETVPLTLDELQNGRKKPNGERYDEGTGLSRPTIISSLKFLEEHQTINIEEIDNERCFGLNFVGKTILPGGLNDFTSSGKMILPVKVSDASNEAESEGPKESIKKTTTKKTTTAPPDAGQNSNGHNGKTPDTPSPLQKVEVEPKTAHQKLFEYVANTWFKAFKYSDGSYYYVINGDFALVSAGKIGAMMKRLKHRFGDKVKPDDLHEFVAFFERRCGNSFLPASDFSLQKWMNEWKSEKRRFDPSVDLYADLIGKPERNK